MSLSQSWQDVAFEAGDYIARPVYSAVLAILVQIDSKDSSVKQRLQLNGNQPTLEKCRLIDQDVSMLIKAAIGKVNLGILDLRYNHISDTGAEHIATYLKSVDCTVETLDLRYNDIGPQGAQSIAESLQLNTSVKELLLDGNPIQRKGGIQVAAMLQVNQTLERLSLGSTELHTDCVIAMATVLQGNVTLKSVDLTRPLLHSQMEESTIHLSRMLKINSTLCELHLSKHSMTDTGVEWLSRTLRENTNSKLQVLNLSCNKLSRDGAKHLSKLLLTNLSLTTLNLSYNRIEDEGLQHISHALASNSTLKRLDVCGNSIGTVGLLSLTSTLLTSNETLSTILVWGNTVEEPTALAFCELFQTGRLEECNSDVKPYKVDGVAYLARTDL